MEATHFKQQSGKWPKQQSRQLTKQQLVKALVKATFLKVAAYAATQVTKLEMGNNQLTDKET